MDRVKFSQGTSEEFEQVNKDENTLYFLTDTCELYKGDQKYGGGSDAEWEELGAFAPIDYVTFTGDNLEFQIFEHDGENKAYDGLLYASVDNNDWAKVHPGDILSGSTIKMAGKNNTHMYYYDEENDIEYGLFHYMYGENCAVSGKLLSLLDTNTEIAQMTNECFMYTFSYTNAITNISNLIFPDYTTDYCYQSMFENCSLLATAPELHAATLATGCYYAMFNGCASLTATPELSATTLSESCYDAMFSNCTSLASVPNLLLQATNLDKFCYQEMFFGCTSLIEAPELPATTLASNCYYSMFQGCTSLTTAPELPATTLTDSSCYLQMFQGCTSLITAPELPATTLAEYCYVNMFSNCTSLVAAPQLPATALAEGCYQFMFSYCTSLQNVPALPATTLARGCYGSMFSNCTSLITLPALPATVLFDYCYSRMFENCTNILLSTTETSTYNRTYRIPSSGSGTLTGTALPDMFTGTGGTFTGTPEINTIYYTSNTII